VYKNISSTIAGVVQGLNATVFAYGSTGRYAFTALVCLIVFFYIVKHALLGVYVTVVCKQHIYKSQ
jgi:hypothetical protein